MFCAKCLFFEFTYCVYVWVTRQMLFLVNIFQRFSIITPQTLWLMTSLSIWGCGILQGLKVNKKNKLWYSFFKIWKEQKIFFFSKFSRREIIVGLIYLHGVFPRCSFHLDFMSWKIGFFLPFIFFFFSWDYDRLRPLSYPKTDVSWKNFSFFLLFLIHENPMKGGVGFYWKKRSISPRCFFLGKKLFFGFSEKFSKFFFNEIDCKKFPNFFFQWIQQ